MIKWNSNRISVLNNPDYFHLQTVLKNQIRKFSINLVTFQHKEMNNFEYHKTKPFLRASNPSSINILSTFILVDQPEARKLLTGPNSFNAS